MLVLGLDLMLALGMVVNILQLVLGLFLLLVLGIVVVVVQLVLGNFSNELSTLVVCQAVFIMVASIIGAVSVSIEVPVAALFSLLSRFWYTVLHAHVTAEVLVALFTAVVRSSEVTVAALFLLLLVALLHHAVIVGVNLWRSQQMEMGRDPIVMRLKIKIITNAATFFYFLFSFDFF